MDWEISSILMMGLLLLICPCAVTAASPVAELHFDEGAGNIAHDSSGHGNNAMIHGATWVDGLTGKALLYDGVNDYTELPHPGILSQGTIEGWVRFSKVPGTYPAGGWMWITISRYPIDQYSDGVDFGVHPGNSKNLAFGIWSDQGWNWADSGVQPQANKWYYLVGTWGPAGIKTYIDGELKGTNSYKGGLWNQTKYCYLGANTWKGYVNGIIDNVVISPTALSPSEIHSRYLTTRAPNASFTATPASGTIPLTVKFDASASSGMNGISSYAWDFGDGTLGQGVSPSHVYKTAGIHTAVLTVTDRGTPSQTGTKNRPINATAAPVTNQKPAASFTASKGSGNASLTVAFNASGSSDTDGNITQYAWDFGDGKKGSGVKTSHLYESAGTYQATLTVTDDKGSSVSTYQAISVMAVKNLPHADFSATPLTGVSPLQVQFNDTSSGDPISWTWDFGDGGSSFVKNPTHSYVSAGNYTVSLRVTNKDGTDTGTRTGYIIIPGGGFPWLPAAAGALVLLLIAGIVFFLWSRSNLKLILKQKTLQADGASTIPVRVQFVNGFGQLKKQGSDRDVEIKATSGMIQNIVVPEGKAFAETSLRASRECGPVTVTARCVAKEVQGRVDFIFVPGKLEVTPNPPEIPADGRSKATVTVRILDASGNGVIFLEDKLVQLTTNLGTIVSPVYVPARSREGTTTIMAGETGGTATINAFLDQIGGVGTIRFIPTGKRYCMYCGTAKRIDAQYCPECGKLPPSGVDTKSCAGCGGVIPQTAQFCDKCGARQP
jgi:PKD repeat protein/predicted nucleic acid-binding Zn ribbon protein